MERYDKALNEYLHEPFDRKHKKAKAPPAIPNSNPIYYDANGTIIPIHRRRGRRRRDLETFLQDNRCDYTIHIKVSKEPIKKGKSKSTDTEEPSFKLKYSVAYVTRLYTSGDIQEQLYVKFPLVKESCTFINELFNLDEAAVQSQPRASKHKRIMYDEDDSDENYIDTTNQARSLSNRSKQAALSDSSSDSNLDLSYDDEEEDGHGPYEQPKKKKEKKARSTTSKSKSMFFDFPSIFVESNNRVYFELSKSNQVKQYTNRPHYYDPNAQSDAEMWCCVCFSEEAEENNPIVQCEKCGMAVHQVWDSAAWRCSSTATAYQRMRSRRITITAIAARNSIIRISLMYVFDFPLFSYKF